jgi:hypothetical protein
VHERRWRRRDAETRRGGYRTTAPRVGPRPRAWRTRSHRDSPLQEAEPGSLSTSNGFSDAELAPAEDGLLRTRLFPGLWIDPGALLARDAARLRPAWSSGSRAPSIAPSSSGCGAWRPVSQLASIVAAFSDATSCKSTFQEWICNHRSQRLQVLDQLALLRLAERGAVVVAGVRVPRERAVEEERPLAGVTQVPLVV